MLTNALRTVGPETRNPPDRVALATTRLLVFPLSPPAMPRLHILSEATEPRASFDNRFVLVSELLLRRRKFLTYV